MTLEAFLRRSAIEALDRSRDATLTGTTVKAGLLGFEVSVTCVRGGEPMAGDVVAVGPGGRVVWRQATGAVISAAGTGPGGEEYSVEWPGLAGGPRRVPYSEAVPLMASAADAVAYLVRRSLVEASRGGLDVLALAQEVTVEDVMTT